MDKKFIAFMAVGVMFFACGSQDVPDSVPDYSNYTLIDNEQNYSEANAVDIVKMVQNIKPSAKLKDGIDFRGSLENSFGTSGDRTTLVLDEDYYQLQLTQGNVISITASNNSKTSSPFSVRFYGPHNRDGYTDTTIHIMSRTNSLETTIGIGHVPPGGNVDAPATFYIKVSNYVNTEQSNYSIYKSTPYAITVKLLKE
jgi:hypothetical protein